MNRIVNLISAMLNNIIDILKQILELLTRMEQGATSGDAAAEEPTPQKQDDDRLYSAKYAAERIGVGERTIYRLTKRGLLPVDSYTLGMRLFRHSDIERCRRFYLGE
ncbi:helix-turn-helix transcriptional regulator [Parapedobacter soli]|uniref:helix-turn-helix transcriptional regulator n=1 Tax=Parapedobacter soli TaxID=416955 RepID=UPI0021C56D35|nr:helix-turn-helix domain-containing protein [Parapedobacter soli]